MKRGYHCDFVADSRIFAPWSASAEPRRPKLASRARVIAASRLMTGAPGVGPTAVSSTSRTGPSSSSAGSGCGGGSWAASPAASVTDRRMGKGRSIATDQGNGLVCILQTCSGGG